MEKTIQNVKEFFKQVEEDHISEYTAQCAYYIILAFIPFLILMITLIQYTNVDKSTLFYIISSTVPENMSPMVLDIVEEVYSKSIGTISISIIFTLWSAGKGLFVLSKGLKSAYGIEENHNYIYSRIMAMIYTAIFIVMLVFALILMVFGNSINQTIQEKFPNYSTISQTILQFRNIGITLLLFVIFTLIYKFVPNNKSKIRNQFPGAAIASISWGLISYAFSIYLNVFKGFSIMYGSLTTIILIMMWLYACMYMILIGAEINKYIEQKFLINKK